VAKLGDNLHGLLLTALVAAALAAATAAAGRRARSAWGAAAPRSARCGRDLAIARVAFERARRSELAELVADHVLRDEHGHVLPAVMDGDRETDHVGHDHRAPRPGLDRPAIVRGGSLRHLVEEVDVDERTFFDRT